MSSNMSQGRLVMTDGSNAESLARDGGSKTYRKEGRVLFASSPSKTTMNDENKASTRLPGCGSIIASSPIILRSEDSCDGTPSGESFIDTPTSRTGPSPASGGDDMSLSENNCSFPLFSPSVESGILRDEGGEPDGYSASSPTDAQEEETEEERIRREQEESEALARQMMAEEAMASYEMSANFLRDNADNYSSEDLAALQAAMAEEDPEEEELEEGPSAELSYDTLLRIGERLGDVKQERWTMIAREKIEKLPTFDFSLSQVETKVEDDSAVKCLVCQCPYEQGEALRRLPCKHCFHIDCVDQWLMSKDICPYCRQSIV